jgi:hypothetical protein
MSTESRQEKGRRGVRMMTANRLRHFGNAKASVERGRLRCDHCQRNIHRHDRYVIVKAVHRDCSDPKLVGQQSFPAKEVI